MQILRGTGSTKHLIKSQIAKGVEDKLSRQIVLPARFSPDV
jgi:hypothetical protein